MLHAIHNAVVDLPLVAIQPDRCVAFAHCDVIDRHGGISTDNEFVYIITRENIGGPIVVIRGWQLLKNNVGLRIFPIPRFQSSDMLIVVDQLILFRSVQANLEAEWVWSLADITLVVV